MKPQEFYKLKIVNGTYMRFELYLGATLKHIDLIALFKKRVFLTDPIKSSGYGLNDGSAGFFHSKLASSHPPVHSSNDRVSLGFKIVPCSLNISIKYVYGYDLFLNE